MLFLKNKETTLNLEGYTVIIPSICVGNAAQLACDLLIASKSLQRIGTLTHAALIPVFGPSAYQHEPEEKVASCELYESAADKLLVIQFRAPLVSRHANSLHKYLAELVKSALRIVVLSGSFGFEKRIIEESPYAYVANTQFKNKYTQQLNVDLVKWKEYTGDLIYGGGNAMQLYKAFDQLETPTMLLFRYLLEGDNSTDAALIVRELNELCDFLQLRGDGSGEGDGGKFTLTVPKSWNLLFGNDVTELLF